MFELAEKVFKKTLAYDISEVKTDEISAKLANILSKCLNKKVKVNGNGITDDIKIEI
jgi:hypothetical protein